MAYQHRRLFVLLLASLIFFGAGLACSLPSILGEREPVWTPAPARATEVSGVTVPTSTPRSTIVAPPAVTSTRSIVTAPTKRATAGAVVAPKPATPTVTAAAVVTGPNTVVVTDADVAAAIASGVTGQEGLEAENLQVHFVGGKVQMTADRLAYGIVQVENLVMIGRLVAQNGQLQFETESVSPRGLVAAALPTMVNQAFKQYASQWYVEEVEMREGEIELTVR